MGKKLTYDEVKKYVELNSDCVLLSTDYVNNSERLWFRCKCGNEFSTRLMTFKQGKRHCFACGSKKQYDEKRLSANELQARLEKCGCTYISGEYKNQKSKFTVRGSCGHEFETNSSRITEPNFNGRCPSCNRRGCQRYSRDEVAKMCRTVGVELLSTDYVDAHSDLVLRCACGEEYTASWNRVQTGQTRCRKCSKKITYGEWEVARWLDKHGFLYKMEHKFHGCGGRRAYPFDFYLPDQNTCIEFDGEQHFRPVAFGGTQAGFEALKQRDAAKDAYCNANGIRLIRIPYTEIKKVSEILENMLIPR